MILALLRMISCKDREFSCGAWDDCRGEFCSRTSAP